jgi:hypothetical protein
MFVNPWISWYSSGVRSVRDVLEGGAILRDRHLA